MSAKIKKMVQSYYDMWNEGDFSKAESFIHSDVHFQGMLGFSMEGIEAFKEYAKSITTAFPGLYHATERVIAEENRAAAYVLYTGEHKGKLYDLEPTDGHIHFNGAAFFTVEDGKFSRIRVLGDRYTLLRQLGVQSCDEQNIKIPYDE